FCLINMPHQNQVFRFLIREGLEHDRIDDAEDGGVGADTQSKRHYSYNSEAGPPCKQSQTISQVLPESLHRVTSRLKNHSERIRVNQRRVAQTGDFRLLIDQAPVSPNESKEKGLTA